MAQRLSYYLNPLLNYKNYIKIINKYKKMDLLAPPDSVRGMTTLNRKSFDKTVEIPCLKLNISTNNYNTIMNIAKKYFLKLKKFKSFNQDNDNLIIYLDPCKVEKYDDIEESDRHILNKIGKIQFDKTEIALNYNNWNADELLRVILPADIEVPTSYTKVGHILHLNLRNDQLPFKSIIGQIYLDTIPQTKTVVNKLNNIETKFRYFEMEILAGDDDTVTTVKENNCKFTFDFAKVYWNSRLCTEHTNLLKFMNKNDVLYDVFAGVGPFSVPAARRGIQVLANDLNPESYKWLQYNATANKAKNLISFNKDGRDFLRDEVKKHLLERRKDNKDGCEHIAMNLPAIAIEFCDIFRNWMNDDEIKLISNKFPLVHLYCFVKVSKNTDPKPIAQTLVEETLGTKLTSESLKNIHHVRNVAPNKEMMRVSFYLTEEILKSVEPVKKKIKLDQDSNDCVEIFAENNGEEQKNIKDQKCLQG
ncbi:tRNA (guanine(37)-N1)-methyltransferase [Microplitis demolitor]|uniref:tRNA (guanine(37)-N1)-methyltransferase n=1 Tax=Microplitis demolitor TaxID=69319 RepID=UPI0004CD5BFA|nr:tRNA (guanine(37)-N1)-methyltransferase [Microplitis demolitor]XP_008551482.1 tRNA (guanine(37)-N1)-methyltransferase [Microplitis demolitor]XP_008551483.1 tRNA (guanine(37)-N1)-methyltransferase [Microplitis demolitor]XP_053597261.1 tRNA (guanine(37)-N1)-methyltransferase [Microplitis demolitor]